MVARVSFVVSATIDPWKARNIKSPRFRRNLGCYNRIFKTNNQTMIAVEQAGLPSFPRPLITT